MTNIIHQSFEIPEYLNAKIPAEYRGGMREHVRMMVLDRNTGETYHDRFEQIDSYLSPGDLLVFNNSRTIPAVLKAEGKIEIRLSRQVGEGQWEALILGETNGTLILPNQLYAHIIGVGSEPPLVKIAFSKAGTELLDDIYQYGEPIRYEYIENPWPLDAYQTVYGSVPGSVEMPSAGRAFSWKLIKRLKQKGINVAFLQLHAGLSYYGNDDWPIPTKHPESFHIPSDTANLVNTTRKSGGRVIAVGTTVVRALETAVNEIGEVEASTGVTNLYIKKGFQLQAVQGLLTGFHEPKASHLDLLTALIEEERLGAAYQEALQQGYLWHEFGDMNLIISTRESK
ncbi:S-adenosylmethionine:tRNA ribosyltransferase-isomerase [Bacillus carboniphilus]|uniref:S-adenosylmethionine:tRNA ribosyltransferase-isomerase n=1 Tax=Bacillus carboniphilus TaxID=86663 RepID=A0ABP3GCN5_9BACI